MIDMKKIIFLILILSIITATVCISASAADPEYNCPVYIYDSDEQRFFGFGYLKFQGDHYDSIIRLYGRNDNELTVDFSAPSTSGNDYFFNELDISGFDGSQIYGINFVSGPDANNLSTLPIIPTHNVTFSNGVIYSTYWDWRDYSLGMAIVLYFNTLDNFVPPHGAGSIESGMSGVVSDLQAIDSNLLLETVPLEDIDDLKDFVQIDPNSPNPFQPLVNTLNIPIVVTMLAIVFSFALVGFVLYGKRA